jgi:hypothetical protein
MVKVYTAFTKEIDSAEDAVNEILGQLRLSETQLANTMGIVSFYYEFAETGVYQAVADALPFEVVGCASSYVGTNDGYGDFALSVTMITSDAIHFTVAAVEDTEDKDASEIFAKLDEVMLELTAKEQPKMLMSFEAPLPNFSGDDLVGFINRMPEPIPLFGTLAFCDLLRREVNHVCHNGKTTPYMIVLAAFYGDFSPTFRVTTSFAYDDNFGEAGVITDAAGSVLKTVDDIPVAEFLNKQGIMNSDGNIVGSSVWAVPAILTRSDGTQVARAFLGTADKEGKTIYAAGNLECGASISFAALDSDKTIGSAGKVLGEIIDSGDENALIYSCAARSFSLGAQYLAEIIKISECAKQFESVNGKSLIYSVAYSAGEICPVPDNSGKLVNALHNYSLISCSF